MRWDHPRVCGEKFAQLPSRVREMGSSPRVRGKAPRYKAVAPELGIIPACAGKSYGGGSFGGFFEDHPRVCGEKSYVPSLVYMYQGSSPRVRGKAVIVRECVDLGGIIPACAGKRGTSSRDSRTSRDHPRVCGEKSSWLIVSRLR